MKKRTRGGRFVVESGTGKLIPADEYYARKRANNAPAVISDNLDSVLNPADGKRYDSKSKYYRAVREAGCEIVGNERIEPKTRQYEPGPVGPDIKRAIEELSSRMRSR